MSEKLSDCHTNDTFITWPATGDGPVFLFLHLQCWFSHLVTKLQAVLLYFRSEKKNVSEVFNRKLLGVDNNREWEYYDICILPWKSLNPFHVLCLNMSKNSIANINHKSDGALWL